MLKKLTGYSLLSLGSFFFFFAVFHTSVNAEGSPIAPLIAQISQSPSPSPQQQQQTTEPTILPTKTPSPSPTETPTPTQKPTDTPTPSPQPKADPPLAETSTPSPTPTITPATQPSQEELEAWFTKYTDTYHIDREQLKKIAQCESGFNTNSNNSGLYLGMYQFSEGTWISTRTAMGSDTNPTLRLHPEEAIKTAAFKIANGGAGSWPNCQ